MFRHGDEFGTVFAAEKAMGTDDAGRPGLPGPVNDTFDFIPGAMGGERFNIHEKTLVNCCAASKSWL